MLGGSKCVLMSIEMEVILHGMEMRRKGLIDKKKGAGRRKTEKIERKKKMDQQVETEGKGRKNGHKNSPVLPEPKCKIC